MKIDKKKCLMLVIEQIENMLYNSKENKEDIENFADWCEGGVVFYIHRDIELKEEIKINEEEEKYCVELMNRIAPSVDNLTNELYKIYDDIEK